jgi:predicted nucleotidyltransferase
VERSITDYILDVCKALNEQRVQYLIVGGTAVAFHGYFRWSYNSAGKPADKFDLDIWYNPTYPNYFKLLNALEQLGQDVTEFRGEQSPDPIKSYFRYDLEKFTLDFLPKLKGLSKFIKSFEKREIVNIKGVDILILNFDDLIADKAENSRPKDLLDIKELKSKRKEI